MVHFKFLNSDFKFFAVKNDKIPFTHKNTAPETPRQ